MSDWIEKDGKKYYEAGYLEMATNTSRRRREKNAELNAANELLTARIAELEKVPYRIVGEIKAVMRKVDPSPTEAASGARWACDEILKRIEESA